MKLSVEGLAALKQAEGREQAVYADSGGAPTIGYGHLLTKSEKSSGKIYIRGVAVRYANGLTDAQIEDLLLQDLDPFEEAVDASVRVPLTPNQFDALVMFAFNCGKEAFAGSTLVKKLNAGDYSAVPVQMRRWIHVNGNRVRGLVNRREHEIRIWSA